MLRRSIVFAAVLAACTRLPAQGQATLGLEADFKGYTFDEGLGPTAAQLFITPVAFRLPIGSPFQVDLYGAWAEGQVERQNATYRLSGFVDSQVKASLTAAPWVVFSVSANIPTGNESHDSEEAVVAAVLSSDLLGFRESTWGNGFALTSGIATAARLGQWGIGLGASYRAENGFEPSTDQSVIYQPGNETRVRFGLDRTVGEAGTFSTGVTLQKFTDDQLEGRNLFQAGNRFMVDASYAFRAGSQTWTLYGSDLWREQGDLFLSLVDGAGKVVGDSTVTTGKQNLISAGFVGAIPLGGTYRLRPSADLRVQSRDEQNGSHEGSGWIMSAGADFPVRVFGAMDLFPRGRYTFGSIEGPDGKDHKAHGAEFGVTVRFGGG